ncbi:MAG TPA: zf-TFIIB domain-containing protein [Steroidobacteraceae bacterium]|nr:zf-TFIIB domain-containing protein [Steroidobacteraceae bacterium]
MKCPRCKTTDLKPTMIEEHLPAIGCANCHGSLVSLVYYRHWAETHKPPETGMAPDTVAAVETTDTMTAITCPKCGRLMTKHKLTGGVPNRVDVCASCDEAWLDRGEWELLEALQLSHSMPSIFTDQWQRRIRRQLSEDMRRSILGRAIGEEGTARVDAFRAWLKETGHKSEIMAYLYRD